MFNPRRLRFTPALVAALAGVLAAPANAGDKLALSYVAIELPGAPAAIVTADVDGDGARDLAVVVAYTAWDRIDVSERLSMDDVEGLVEVLTVVPALLDRRQLWLFSGDGRGGYRPAAEPLELPTSVLSLLAGPPGLPAIALTDDGVAVLRLRRAGGVPSLALEPVLADPPVLAGGRTFVPELPLVQDADGDGVADLLLPAAGGLHLYRGTGDGVESEPVTRLELPVDPAASRPRQRYVPLPEARDVDGDGRPDLLVAGPVRGAARPHVLRGLGGGRFAPPIEPAAAAGDAAEEDEEVVYFGDLDGDGVAEWVRRELLIDEDAGWRKGMRQAKRPPARYHLYRAAADLAPAPQPYATFEATGYAFVPGGEDGDGEQEIRVPGGFQDLDGDGRQDLITLTLDFSILQAVRILATRSLSIAIDFHLWCQDRDGAFRPVRDLDLSGRFKIDLDNFRIGQLSQFAGDFDGDGRADFVQLGRGKKVSIHRGGDGCRYPPAPDLEIELAAEPKNLALVRIGDLDGDRLADLLIIQPQEVVEAGVTAPVRLDLYLSGGSR